jgi:hypothetical protein
MNNNHNSQFAEMAGFGQFKVGFVLAKSVFNKSLGFLNPPLLQTAKAMLCGQKY